MEVTYRDRAVYLEDTLVLADLHVGRGETSTMELPVGDSSDMLDRFGTLLSTFAPERVVVAGDFLHAFETLPLSVERDVAGFQNRANDANASMIVTPGNHDVMLDAVWDGATAESVRVGDALLCHGHELPDAEADLYVIGHDHPTITIEGQRRPCYLRGPGPNGGEVLMLPSFNRLPRGVEVNEMADTDFQSPLIRDTDSLRPIVWDEEDDDVLSFPPLGEFRGML